jgi:multiple sugar transport system permease protein
MKPHNPEKLSAYLFILPNFLGFAVFTFLPLLASLCLSFAEWDGIRPLSEAHAAGLQNYTAILGWGHQQGRLLANDPQFWQSLYNTVYLMGIIPVSMAGSLLLALLMNRSLRGITAYRAIYFLPVVCPLVAVCLLWKWILNPDYGLINTALAMCHINGPRWLESVEWAKPGLMLMSLWIAIGGYNCILYLAGLQNIPEEFYEAAQLDGANWWQRLRHVTWPQLAPTTFFILTMSLIAGFQGGFTQAYLMTHGGPIGSTTTITYYVFHNAFEVFRMGRAAAIAWVLFLLVFGATLINWRSWREARTVVT